MASSDDEEIMPKTVTNYYFVDNDESPISFAVLPVHFGDAEKKDNVIRVVFLHGTTDGGLQKIFKQVVAWKLEFEDDHPKITVLSKDNKWINLLKPRKSYYEDTIRTIMITLEVLHFLRKKSQASEKSLWEHLRLVFSTFEVRPSEDDWSEHLSLMKLFSEKDDVLANSQLLKGIIEGKPRKSFHEGTVDSSDLKQSFIASADEVDEIIIDDDNYDNDNHDNDSHGNDNHDNDSHGNDNHDNDSHGNDNHDNDNHDDDNHDDDGSSADDNHDDEPDLFDSVCAICDNGGDLLCCEGPCLRSFHATLEAGEESSCESLGYTEAKVEAIQNFLCDNCLYKQHQCFCCGRLGSSDKTKVAEVYPCASATCGHFYHPKCVAELLFPGSEAEASEIQKQIIGGESFTCPVHKCVVCKQGEDKEVRDLQFAICRRCPKSYHRKCLPRKISFEDIEEDDVVQRAWDKLLPNRILIYCLKHKIDEEMGTPIRNHIKFPENPEKKRLSDVQKNKVKALAKRKSLVHGEVAASESTAKSFKVTSSEENRSREKVVRSNTQHVLGFQKKEKYLKENSLALMYIPEKTVIEDNRIPVKEKLPRSSFPDIDSEIEANVLALYKETSLSLSMEGIMRERSVPSTHTYGSTRHIDRTITLGKVEASVQAVQTALKKLENGGTLEDAKAVCEPDVLKQLLKWREKLRVYLAPFLHGMRYTSFGRHFTKVDKLKQIVDKVQWYVQEGDTVVDFCCGANDFSILMKDKLDAAGKKCDFKNYDIIQPKNDFNFERRDWMKVKPKELPNGSKLIMGLNPPFGVKAALANKFIDQALLFKPKLLILIVPKETERLDKKNPPYDIIWEDDESLTGKSFYLPGSVDVNDKQIEQWNLSAPPLYLWSRPDWTSTHREIAKRHGHTNIEESPAEKDTPVEKPARVLPAEDHKEVEFMRSDSILDVTQARKKERRSPGRSNKRTSIENNGGSQMHKRSKKGRVSEERKELSDMSVSPDDITQRGNRPRSYHLSESTETPRPSSQDPYFTSGKEFSVTTVASDIFRNSVNDDIDEIARKYASPAAGESLFNRNPHGWQGGGIENNDYGAQSSEPRFFDYRRDNTDSFSRSSYLSDVHGYKRSSEADLRAQIRYYGTQNQDDQPQRSRTSLGVSDAGFGPPRFFPPYGLPSTSTISSAMDRYAPRLDETNYVRTGNHAPHGPFPGRSEIYDYTIHGVRRGSMGYAPGSNSSLHHPGPSGGGWVDD